MTSKLAATNCKFVFVSVAEHSRQPDRCYKGACFAGFEFVLPKATESMRCQNDCSNWHQAELDSSASQAGKALMPKASLRSCLAALRFRLPICI